MKSVRLETDGTGWTEEERQEVTDESEREKVREDNESDGTKGSCGLDSNQVC